MIRYEIYHRALRLKDRILADLTLLFCGAGISLAIMIMRIHRSHRREDD